MTTDPKMLAPSLLVELRAIVGGRYLVAGSAARRFTRGYRYGQSLTALVVRPASLVDLWRVAQVCVRHDATIIMQAANTGLTGGSVADGDDYPGGAVIINTMRIAGIIPLDDWKQVICLPGTTLSTLELRLRAVGREPHSVIGSSCLGATVVGGVCNNSGGSLVRRGPAYTECALFARITAAGELELVNNLGIEFDEQPEAVLRRVEAGDLPPIGRGGAASDPGYTDHVRDIDAATPARFNNDPRRLFEAAGSAGKVIVFATRLDTFERQAPGTVFYVGTNAPDSLTDLRRAMLGEGLVPIAAEYMDRATFDIADMYGKDSVAAIDRLGTDRLPLLFAAKARVDTIGEAVGLRALSDRVLQRVSGLLGDQLPARLRDYRDRYRHYLLLKVGADQVERVSALLAAAVSDETDFFECSAAEADRAFLHRFAAAGAAVRYRAIHPTKVEDIVALDVALPRKTRDWVDDLPPELEAQTVHKLAYGHFFCQVFHRDYIVAKGVDALAYEHRLWRQLDACGAEYPAEHNVGHLYKAKPALVDFYRRLDPRNQLNPGIGQTSRARHWGESG